MRKGWFFIALALFLLFSSDRLWAADKIRFGTAVKGSPLWNLPFLAAEENGFWKQNNLEVEWIAFTSSSPLARAVAAGSIDMGLDGTSGAVLAMAAGVPKLIVAEGGGKPGWIIWVRTDSPLKSPKELEGTRIGVVGLGGTAHAFGRVTVKALGLKNVRFVGVGGARERTAALKTGSIDAAAGGYVSEIYLQIAGEIRALVDMGEHLPKEWSDHVITASKAFLGKNPDAVRRGIRGMLQANSFILKNPQWATERMKSYFGYTPEVSRAVYEALRFSTDGKIDRRAIQNVLSLMVEYELIAKEKALPAEKLYTAEFTG